MITRKIRFYPNKQQRKIFEKCFNAHRYFYNKSIAQLKSESKAKEKLSLTLSSLRNKVMHNDTALEPHELWQKDIPFDTRQLAIKEAIGSYKSGIQLIKNKHIKHFEHKFKRKKDNIQIFHVDKDALKNNKIFIRRLGKTKSVIYLRKKNRKLLQDFLPNGVENDFKIQKTNTDKYYLILSKMVEKENITKKYNQIALDPGVRTFQTGYSPEGVIIESGQKDLNQIRKLHNLIDKLQSLRTKGNKSIINRIHKLHEKCVNITNNLHRQVISFLTKNFNEVYLPSFDTKKMLMCEGRKICAKTAREMQILSFYRFKELLKYVANRRNTKVFIVDEKYTTKTCGNCGNMQNMGSNKIYNCDKCHISLPRDINAARNIFMKNVELNQ